MNLGERCCCNTQPQSTTWNSMSQSREENDTRHQSREADLSQRLTDLESLLTSTNETCSCENYRSESAYESTDTCYCSSQSYVHSVPKVFSQKVESPVRDVPEININEKDNCGCPSQVKSNTQSSFFKKVMDNAKSILSLTCNCPSTDQSIPKKIVDRPTKDLDQWHCKCEEPQGYEQNVSTPGISSVPNSSLQDDMCVCYNDSAGETFRTTEFSEGDCLCDSVPVFEGTCSCSSRIVSQNNTSKIECGCCLCNPPPQKIQNAPSDAKKADSCYICYCHQGPFTSQSGASRAFGGNQQMESEFQTIQPEPLEVGTATQNNPAVDKAVPKSGTIICNCKKQSIKENTIPATSRAQQMESELNTKVDKALSRLCTIDCNCKRRIENIYVAQADQTQTSNKSKEDIFTAAGTSGGQHRCAAFNNPKRKNPNKMNRSCFPDSSYKTVYDRPVCGCKETISSTCNCLHKCYIPDLVEQASNIEIKEHKLKRSCYAEGTHFNNTYDTAVCACKEDVSTICVCNKKCYVGELAEIPANKIENKMTRSCYPDSTYEDVYFTPVCACKDKITSSCNCDQECYVADLAKQNITTAETTVAENKSTVCSCKYCPIKDASAGISKNDAVVITDVARKIGEINRGAGKNITDFANAEASKNIGDFLYICKCDPKDTKKRKTPMEIQKDRADIYSKGPMAVEPPPVHSVAVNVNKSCNDDTCKYRRKRSKSRPRSAPPNKPCPCPDKTNVDNENSTCSITSREIKYMKLLTDLTTKENTMKKQIQELQQREKSYKCVLKNFENMISSKNEVDCRCGSPPITTTTTPAAITATMTTPPPSYDFGKVSRELKMENRQLKSELQSVKLELKQCLDRIQGPLQQKLEDEKCKCLQLEQELKEASNEMMINQDTYVREMNSLKMQLCCACTNMQDLNAMNKRLKDELTSLDCMCGKLEEDLMRQKVSEAETIKRLAKRKDAGGELPCGFPEREMTPVPNRKYVSDDEENLHVIARKLSKTLRESAPCEECAKLPVELAAAAKCIKDLTDMVDKRKWSKPKAIEGIQTSSLKDCYCQSLPPVETEGCQCQCLEDKAVRTELKMDIIIEPIGDSQRQPTVLQPAADDKQITSISEQMVCNICGQLEKIPTGSCRTICRICAEAFGVDAKLPSKPSIKTAPAVVDKQMICDECGPLDKMPLWGPPCPPSCTLCAGESFRDGKLTEIQSKVTAYPSDKKIQEKTSTFTQYSVCMGVPEEYLARAFAAKPSLPCPPSRIAGAGESFKDDILSKKPSKVIMYPSDKKIQETTSSFTQYSVCMGVPEEHLARAFAAKPSQAPGFSCPPSCIAGAGESVKDDTLSKKPSKVTTHPSDKKIQETTSTFTQYSVCMGVPEEHLARAFAAIPSQVRSPVKKSSIPPAQMALPTADTEMICDVCVPLEKVPPWGPPCNPSCAICAGQSVRTDKLSNFATDDKVDIPSSRQNICEVCGILEVMPDSGPPCPPICKLCQETRSVVKKEPQIEDELVYCDECGPERKLPSSKCTAICAFADNVPKVEKKSAGDFVEGEKTVQVTTYITPGVSHADDLSVFSQYSVCMGVPEEYLLKAFRAQPSYSHPIKQEPIATEEVATVKIYEETKEKPTKYPVVSDVTQISDELSTFTQYSVCMGVPEEYLSKAFGALPSRTTTYTSPTDQKPHGETKPAVKASIEPVQQSTTECICKPIKEAADAQIPKDMICDVCTTFDKSPEFGPPCPVCGACTRTPFSEEIITEKMSKAVTYTTGEKPREENIGLENMNILTDKNNASVTSKPTEEIVTETTSVSKQMVCDECGALEKIPEWGPPCPAVCTLCATINANVTSEEPSKMTTYASDVMEVSEPIIVPQQQAVYEAKPLQVTTYTTPAEISIGLIEAAVSAIRPPDQPCPDTCKCLDNYLQSIGEKKSKADEGQDLEGQKQDGTDTSQLPGLDRDGKPSKTIEDVATDSRNLKEIQMSDKADQPEPDQDKVEQSEPDQDDKICKTTGDVATDMSNAEQVQMQDKAEQPELDQDDKTSKTTGDVATDISSLKQLQMQDKAEQPELDQNDETCKTTGDVATDISKSEQQLQMQDKAEQPELEQDDKTCKTTGDVATDISKSEQVQMQDKSEQPELDQDGKPSQTTEDAATDISKAEEIQTRDKAEKLAPDQGDKRSQTTEDVATDISKVEEGQMEDKAELVRPDQDGKPSETTEDIATHISKGEQASSKEIFTCPCPPSIKCRESLGSRGQLAVEIGEQPEADIIIEENQPGLDQDGKLSKTAEDVATDVSKVEEVHMEDKAELVKLDQDGKPTQTTEDVATDIPKAEEIKPDEDGKPTQTTEDRATDIPQTEEVQSQDKAELLGLDDDTKPNTTTEDPATESAPDQQALAEDINKSGPRDVESPDGPLSGAVQSPTPLDQEAVPIVQQETSSVHSKPPTEIETPGDVSFTPKTCKAECSQVISDVRPKCPGLVTKKADQEEIVEDGKRDSGNKTEETAADKLETDEAPVVQQVVSNVESQLPTVLEIEEAPIVQQITNNIETILPDMLQTEETPLVEQITSNVIEEALIIQQIASTVESKPPTKPRAISSADNAICKAACSQLANSEGKTICPGQPEGQTDDNIPVDINTRTEVSDNPPDLPEVEEVPIVPQINNVLSKPPTEATAPDVISSPDKTACNAPCKSEGQTDDNFPFDVNTRIEVLDSPPEATHVTTTITASGTLEVITEGAAGLIETTLTYNEDGNVEVLTEVTEYADDVSKHSGSVASKKSSVKKFTAPSKDMITCPCPPTKKCREALGLRDQPTVEVSKQPEADIKESMISGTTGLSQLTTTTSALTGDEETTELSSHVSELPGEGAGGGDAKIEDMEDEDYTTTSAIEESTAERDISEPTVSELPSEGPISATTSTVKPTSVAVDTVTSQLQEGSPTTAEAGATTEIIEELIIPEKDVGVQRIRLPDVSTQILPQETMSAKTSTVKGTSVATDVPLAIQDITSASTSTAQPISTVTDIAGAPLEKISAITSTVDATDTQDTSPEMISAKEPESEIQDIALDTTPDTREMVSPDAADTETDVHDTTVDITEPSSQAEPPSGDAQLKPTSDVIEKQPLKRQILDCYCQSTSTEEKSCRCCECKDIGVPTSRDTTTVTEMPPTTETTSSRTVAAKAKLQDDSTTPITKATSEFETIPEETELETEHHETTLGSEAAKIQDDVETGIDKDKIEGRQSKEVQENADTKNMSTQNKRSVDEVACDCTEPEICTKNKCVATPELAKVVDQKSSAIEESMDKKHIGTQQLLPDQVSSAVGDTVETRNIDISALEDLIETKSATTQGGGKGVDQKSSAIPAAGTTKDMSTQDIKQAVDQISSAINGQPSKTSKKSSVQSFDKGSVESDDKGERGSKKSKTSRTSKSQKDDSTVEKRSKRSKSEDTDGKKSCQDRISVKEESDIDSDKRNKLKEQKLSKDKDKKSSPEGKRKGSSGKKIKCDCPGICECEVCDPEILKSRRKKLDEDCSCQPHCTCAICAREKNKQLKKPTSAQKTHHPDCKCIECMCSPCEPTKFAIQKRTVPKMVHPPDCDCVDCLCDPCADICISEEIEEKVKLNEGCSTNKTPISIDDVFVTSSSYKTETNSSIRSQDDCFCKLCTCKSTDFAIQGQKKNNSQVKHPRGCECVDCLCVPKCVIEEIAQRREFPIVPQNKQVYQVTTRTNKPVKCPVPSKCQKPSKPKCKCTKTRIPVPTSGGPKKIVPCDCTECKCDPCADPNIRAKSKTKASLGASQQNAVCDCGECTCTKCFDKTKGTAQLGSPNQTAKSADQPTAKEQLTCDCGKCDCAICFDRAVREAKEKEAKENESKQKDAEPPKPENQEKNVAKGDSNAIHPPDCDCALCVCPGIEKYRQSKVKSAEGSKPQSGTGDGSHPPDCDCADCTCPGLEKYRQNKKKKLFHPPDCDCVECTCPGLEKYKQRANRPAECDCDDCVCPGLEKWRGAALKKVCRAKAPKKTHPENCDCEKCTCPGLLKWVEGEPQLQSCDCTDCSCDPCPDPLKTKVKFHPMTCDCEECICIKCADKTKAKPVVEQPEDKRTEEKLPDDTQIEDCTCPECVCEEESKIGDATRILPCDCETCDCVECLDPSKKPVKKETGTHAVPCDCPECVCVVCPDLSKRKEEGQQTGVDDECTCTECDCPAGGDTNTDVQKTREEMCSCTDCICLKDDNKNTTETHAADCICEVCQCSEEEIMMKQKETSGTSACTCKECICYECGDKKKQRKAEVSAEGCICEKCECSTETTPPQEGTKVICDCASCKCVQCSDQSKKKTTIQQGESCDCESCKCMQTEPSGDHDRKCNCDSCKCIQCSDESKNKTKTQTDSQTVAEKQIACDCSTCRCIQCSDPSKRKFDGCTCQTCTCKSGQQKIEGNLVSVDTIGEHPKDCDCFVCTCPRPTPAEPEKDKLKFLDCDCSVCRCAIDKAQRRGDAADGDKNENKACDCPKCQCKECSEKPPEEKERCEYKECECVNCSNRKKSTPAPTEIPKQEPCEFKPCECKTCSNKSAMTTIPEKVAEVQAVEEPKPCEHQVCECVTCSARRKSPNEEPVAASATQEKSDEKPPEVPIFEMPKAKSCDCKICECLSCTGKAADPQKQLQQGANEQQKSSKTSIPPPFEVPIAKPCDCIKCECMSCRAGTDEAGAPPPFEIPEAKPCDCANCYCKNCATANKSGPEEPTVQTEAETFEQPQRKLCDCGKCDCIVCSDSASKGEASQPTGQPAGVEQPTEVNQPIVADQPTGVDQPSTKVENPVEAGQTDPKGNNESQVPKTKPLQSCDCPECVCVKCPDPTKTSKGVGEGEDLNKKCHCPTCTCENRSKDEATKITPKPSNKDDSMEGPHKKPCHCPTCTCDTDLNMKANPEQTPEKTSPPCDCPKCLCENCPDKTKGAKSEEIGVIDINKMDDETLKQTIVDHTRENCQCREEIKEIRKALNQIKCACTEAELKAMRNKPQMKQGSTFGVTMSGLKTALANLQEKCKAKDKMIESMTGELKMRVSSNTFEQTLNKIPKIKHPVDYDKGSDVHSFIKNGDYNRCPPCPFEEEKEITHDQCDASCRCASHKKTLEPIGEHQRKTSRRSERRPSSPRSCKCSTAAGGSRKDKRDAPKVDVSGLEILDIRRITQDSLIIKWAPPQSSQIVGYDIFVNGTYKSKVMSGGRTSAMIHSLDLSCSVQVTIYAVSKYGRCEPPAIAIFEVSN